MRNIESISMFFWGDFFCWNGSLKMCTFHSRFFIQIEKMKSLLLAARGKMNAKALFLLIQIQWNTKPIKNWFWMRIFEWNQPFLRMSFFQKWYDLKLRSLTNYKTNGFLNVFLRKCKFIAILHEEVRMDFNHFRYQKMQFRLWQNSECGL